MRMDFFYLVCVVGMKARSGRSSGHPSGLALPGHVVEARFFRSGFLGLVIRSGFRVWIPAWFQGQVFEFQSCAELKRVHGVLMLVFCAVF